MLFALLIKNVCISQNTCSSPTQLCFGTNTVLSFPANTSTVAAQIGPNYGCLGNPPRPTWLYFKTPTTIATTTTQLILNSTAGTDIDCIMWGPFSSNTNFCFDVTNASAIVDCSFSPSPTETLTIGNTQANQYYILMVSNYLTTPTNININVSQGLTNIFCPFVNADFSLSNASICIGQSVTLTDLSASSGSITSWNYTCTGATPAVSTVQNPTLTFSTAGIYSITQTVNSVGLNSIKTHTIQVNANTTSGVSTQSITCGGVCNASASVTPINAGPFTYSWSPIASTAQSVINLCAGNYTCVIKNVCGLTLTKTVTISQPPILNASIIATTSSVCASASVGLNSSLSGGTPPYTISWSNGAASANTTVTPTTTPSVNYTLNVTDSKGCLKSTSTTIQVYPIPIVTANHLPLLPLCAGKTATITISGATNYTTTPGNITLPSFTVNPTSTTIYNIVGKSTQGCIGFDSDTINVVSLPTVGSSASSPTTCLNEIITFTNTGANTYTLLPTSFTGSVISTAINTVGVTTFTIQGSGPAGCINTKTVSITTFSLPVVNVNPTNQTICEGNSISITASGAQTYTWNTGSTFSTINVLPVTPTTTYSVIGKNTQGCKNSASSIINLIAKPVLSISSPSSIVCQGYTMQVVVTGASTYSWSTGSVNDTIVIQPFFNQTYSVVGTNVGICKDTAFLPITVLLAPTVSAITSNTLICNNQTATLTASGSAITYSWMPGFLIGNPQTVTINAPTTFTVYGQGSNGCANFSTVFIDLKNTSNLTPITTPSNICIGDSAILSVTGGYIPLWANNPHPNTEVVKPNTNSTYTANAIDANGCTSTIIFTVTIDEKCDVTIFNGFTPNGDGVNDYWIIENISKFPNNQVVIFNRWGNKIYQTTQYDNINNKWDGKFKGKTVDSGTYFYTLLTKDGSLIKKGWIEVTN